MDTNDERDLWKDDANRLAEILTTILPVIKILALGRGVVCTPSAAAANLAAIASTALGVHTTLRNLLETLQTGAGQPGGPTTIGDRLSPCPFCGDPASLEMTPPGNGLPIEVYRGTCPSCGAQGPARGDKEAAIRAWNASMKESYSG